MSSTTKAVNKTTVNNMPQPFPSPRRTRWIAEGELSCSGPGCGKPIPAGYYGTTKRIYVCCHNCNYKYNLTHRKKTRCDYCHKLFVKTGNHSRMSFCCRDHLYAYRREHTDARVGRFAPVFREFLQDYATRYYSESTFNTTRCNLARFLEFLVKSGIRSLESVKPRTISAFLEALRAEGLRWISRPLGCVRLFFDWLIFTERRKSVNPIIPKIHGQRRAKRLPRPYSTSELGVIWGALDEQDDIALKVAVSLGEQAALRIGEVCNVRVQDVSVEAQEVFVRLPNKTNTERVVPFHDRTKQLLIQWLAIRGEHDHDFLFTTPNGTPLYKYTLRKKLNKLLCGPGKLEKFSFHRLRHRAATAMRRAGADTTSVMRTFGWRNPAVAQGYMEVLPDEIRTAYDRAMSTAEELEHSPKAKVQSLSEFFSNSAPAPASANTTQR